MDRPNLGACLLGLVVAAWAAPAGAQSIIKYPGDHPDYVFEAEPHLLIPAPFEDKGFGLGFRGTVVIVDNGFVSSINNSVGIGFGLDWLLCRGHGRDFCGEDSDFILPVVMQWNFWLHEKWSVFGEPGVAFRLREGHVDDRRFDWLALYAGGRYHFSDAVALTMRLGRPTFSIGLSFLM